MFAGFTEHIEYEAGSGRQALAPNATLMICEEVSCEPTKVVASMKLDVDQPDVENVCEIDSESMGARNEHCGERLCVNSLLVDLINMKKTAHVDNIVPTG